MRKNKQIFILGISRTGSKFYMQLLNSHDSIFIAPEILFKHKYKKDLAEIINRCLKNKSKIIYDNIIDAIFESNLKDTSMSTINLINKDDFFNNLKTQQNINAYKIFDLIIELAAKSKGKKIWGAKFPIHFSYTNELLKEISNCLVLFLTRDPRDIYVSDYTKKSREKKTIGNKFPVKGYLLKPAVLFYTIREWRRSLNVYDKLQKSKYNDRVQLFKYENIISQKDDVVKDVANFIDESPQAFSTKEMKVVDSSFSKKLELNRWRDQLSFIEKFIFKIAIGRKMKKYGYY